MDQMMEVAKLVRQRCFDACQTQAFFEDNPKGFALRCADDIDKLDLTEILTQAGFIEPPKVG